LDRFEVQTVQEAHGAAIGLSSVNEAEVLDLLIGYAIWFGEQMIKPDHTNHQVCIPKN
jgi:hypothetical protein